ncbi:hypothetical protein ACN06F_09205 [Vreelandella sp. 21]|uniref:hypothetical protein n=1 Tax=Vreelandella TaxID=3137766 RepID=UPI00295EE2C7|nr:hypothetical protein [Halomonas venusta]MDW0357693.1 hypothetical protein [Halomonas venusta]
MTRYLPDDRRRKQEGEHLTNVVKVRFTDAELADIEQAAEMTTGGRIAPLLHELSLEALEARRMRQAQLLDDLANGRPLDKSARQALADLMARNAERHLLDKVAQRAMA